MVSEAEEMRLAAYEAYRERFGVRGTHYDATLRLAGEAMAYLSALLTVRAEQCAESGLRDEAREMAAMRRECRMGILLLGPDDGPGIDALMGRYLEVAERMLFETRWCDARNMLRETFAQGRTRPIDGTVTLLTRLWPWARRFDLLENGWASRFGVEMLEDMQEVIDMGLTGFKIDDVKEKYGALRVYFDDCPYDYAEDRQHSDRWIGLADLMSDLLCLYESLSAVTCVRCGSFGPVRASGGWILPICRCCAHASPLHDWETMAPLDGPSLGSWAKKRNPAMRSPQLAGANIRRLMRLRDAEVKEASAHDET